MNHPGPNPPTLHLSVSSPLLTVFLLPIPDLAHFSPVGGSTNPQGHQALTGLRVRMPGCPSLCQAHSSTRAASPVCKVGNNDPCSPERAVQSHKPRNKQGNKDIHWYIGGSQSALSLLRVLVERSGARRDAWIPCASLLGCPEPRALPETHPHCPPCAPLCQGRGGPWIPLRELSCCSWLLRT